MHIMSACMHTLSHSRIVKSRFFFHRQCIHITADQDALSFFLISQQRDQSAFPYFIGNDVHFSKAVYNKTFGFW